MRRLTTSSPGFCKNVRSKSISSAPALLAASVMASFQSGLTLSSHNPWEYIPLIPQRSHSQIFGLDPGSLQNELNLRKTIF